MSTVCKEFLKMQMITQRKPNKWFGYSTKKDITTANKSLGMVAHTCNCSSHEAEAGGLPHEFKANELQCKILY